MAHELREGDLDGHDPAVVYADPFHALGYPARYENFEVASFSHAAVSSSTNGVSVSRTRAW